MLSSDTNLSLLFICFMKSPKDPMGVSQNQRQKFIGTLDFVFCVLNLQELLLVPYKSNDDHSKRLNNDNS